MKKKELTTWEADRQLHADLLERAWRANPRFMGADKKQVEKDEAAFQRDLRREAAKKQRAALAEHAALTPVLVHCTACGKPHTGTRRGMAKFRKCCDTSTAERKYCRCCAKVITHEGFLAAGGYAKGWSTLATCDACGGRA